MEYAILLSELEDILGKSHKKARNNYAFHCPFCNHRKPKLEVQLVTNDRGQNPWECWVCRSRGRTIKSLLFQLKTPKNKVLQVLKYVKNSDTTFLTEDSQIELPEDFTLLHTSSETSLTARQVKGYLYERGLNDYDFKRYSIGYCMKGDYADRIIIPSYDSNNQLNYFVARTYRQHYYKYKNPPVSRDVIFFENLINWNQPVVLVEGVFDAMAVRRNAIPILGKNLSKSLKKKLLETNVQDIYIALDKDALKDALSIYDNLVEMGKNVYLVNPEDKDPSQIGFNKFTEQIMKLEPLTFSSLLKLKMSI